MTSDLQSSNHKDGSAATTTPWSAVTVFGVTITAGILIALTMIYGVMHHDGLLAVYLALNIILCVATFGESGNVFKTIGSIKLGVLAAVVLLQVTFVLLGRDTMQHFYLVLPIGMLEGCMWREWGRSRAKREIEILSTAEPYEDHPTELV